MLSGQLYISKSYTRNISKLITVLLGETHRNDIYQIINCSVIAGDRSRILKTYLRDQKSRSPRLMVFPNATLKGNRAIMGPFMGGPQCCLSILRNDNVPWRHFLHFPVDFRIAQCRLSTLRNANVPCFFFQMLSVDFKDVYCRLSCVHL